MPENTTISMMISIPLDTWYAMYNELSELRGARTRLNILAEWVESCTYLDKDDIKHILGLKCEKRTPVVLDDVDAK